MAWNYAELSKMAKANKYLSKKKAESDTELELAKQELIQGIKNYDAIKAKGTSGIIVKKFSGNKKEHINLLLLADEQEDMIDFVFSYYTDCQTMLVGTGDVPSALSFYQKCGFVESHRIKNFFTDNYDHLIFEDGKQLIDMVYL